MSGPKADAILSKTGSSGKKKKHKRSGGPSSFIQDEDDMWGNSATLADDDDDAIARGDIVIASDRSFKKRRPQDGSGWETVRAVTPPPPDEQPMVVDTEEAQPMGGILGKAQLARMRGNNSKDQQAPPPVEQETVYRDKSGRKIDTKAERAAEAREKRIREEKDAEKMEWGKGIVQRGEEERVKRELELERTRDLARYAVAIS